MAASTLHALPFFALFLAAGLLPAPEAQQAYVDNRQLDCYNPAYNNITQGFVCNGPSSCRSYLTFRADPPYDTAATIASILNASASEIQSLNGLPSADAQLPRRQLVIVPVNCSCTGDSGSGSGGRYYQHNATYRLSGPEETYFSVANNTYQALTTCQAMMKQNPYGDTKLTVGLNLLVPLRCACPTRNQTAAGVKYLLTYLVAEGNSISGIAEMFDSNETAVNFANELSSDLIFFFTPLLVPLTTEPSRIQIPQPQSPPPQSPPATPPPAGSGSSSHKWIYIGIGIGAALLLAILASVFLFWFCKRRSRQEKPLQSTEDSSIKPSSVPKTLDSKSWSVDVSSSETLGIKSALESLTLYKFPDLQAATSNFSDSNKIKGSVYRASINGADAAVKMIKGGISSDEINLLKKINHSNIIRLSGFCIRGGNSYLVYEYAENGSVSDWIHSNNNKFGSCLTWKQRVTIARDVADALNYLHNGINPTNVHKNLKSSNILLDSNFRAKIANFGLARILNKDDDQDGNGDLNFQLTRHVIGTQGYLPPEYVENGVITPKLDVFAFGVVVLELLSGKEPLIVQTKKKENGEEEEEEVEEQLCETISQVLDGDNVREKLLEFIDPCLEQEYPFELAYSLAMLAKNCVARDLNARPSVDQVLTTLSMIVSSSMEWEPTDELLQSGSISSSR